MRVPFYVLTQHLLSPPPPLKGYEEQMQMWSQPGYQILFTNLFAARSSGAAPTAALEVGCGPGDSLLRCLPQLPDGCKYTATDYATEMVALARETLPEAVEVCCADSGVWCMMMTYRRVVTLCAVGCVLAKDSQLLD
jgi:SAM-dependent methyltransferase